MSFLGSIGAVMADNELREILAEIFNGVDKIIVGKKFVMDLGALRMMVNKSVASCKWHNYMDFNIFLNEIAKESLTTKHWVENLIKPIFITYF